MSACNKSSQQESLSDESMQTQESNPQNRTFKILHIMSYHLPWQWTSDQLRGFKDALKGLDVEYKIYQMDTKRNSSDEWKQKAGQEARDLIQTWKPDLVYTNDDNAQEFVTRHFINQELPFVFSAVNADPEVYGFIGSTNITGVLEHEHFVETVELLRDIVPDIKRIAVIVDDDPTWIGVMQRMEEKDEMYLPEIEFFSWDIIKTFEEYKKKIVEYQTKADAIALLGIHTFKDEYGHNVAWQDVLIWTAENSMLPDFSFWEDRVNYGTLCAVYVSAYDQGLAAGHIARGILEEGRSPASYPMQPSLKGQPVISLARANKLGIPVKSKILLTIKVEEKFQWER